MYQKQIEQLIVLQEVDDEILALQSEVEQAPLELADLEAQMEDFREHRSRIDEKMEILKEQQKKLTSEIEEDAGKIKKSKNKLMLVGNTKEYHAMMREMDSLEKLNRMRDDEQGAVKGRDGPPDRGHRDPDREHGRRAGAVRRAQDHPGRAAGQGR